MTDKVRIRKCPWNNCYHRFDEDGNVVHMRRGVIYVDGEYQGGSPESIVAMIEVEASTKKEATSD